jgi:dephospho-CoA kinase
MRTIGLVGGVASGKSLVAKMLVELGAGLLDADRTGHEVLKEDQVKTALRERWGDEVFTDGGEVDRQAVAARVFGSSEEARENRRFLEGLLHPRIRQRLEQQRREYASAGRPAVVVDAPLLLEAGWGPMCDIIVFIDVPREKRLARARQRGWTESAFAYREAAQMPVEEKRRAAHVVIPNDSSESELRRAVEQFWYANVAH